MNRLNVLITILCLTLFINGCQKDSIIDNAQPENKLQNTDIELRSYDEETCGRINELCLKCHIEFEEGPTVVVFPRLSESDGRTPQVTEGIDNNYLEIIIDGESYTIRPANYFGEQTQEYLISTPKGNYITSNIQNEYVRSKALKVELPDVLQNVYKLDHKRFIDGNLDFDEVQGVFGQKTELIQSREEGYIIGVEGSGISAGGVDLILYDPCSGVSMSALVLKYQETLGMNDPHTNAPQIIEDALNANSPTGFDPTTDCPNTQDVVESILNDPQIVGSSFAQFLIKLNYLDALLDLEDSEYAQLQPSSNQSFVNMLYTELNEDETTLCANADCSYKQAVGSLIGFHLYSGETVLQEDIEDTKDFYQYLYCQNSILLRTISDIGGCGQQYITLFLRDNSLGYSELETLIERYEEARLVYHGNTYGPSGRMRQRLQEQGVSWCDMVEITNVMYGTELGLPTFAPDAAEGRADANAGVVLLAFKALGEGFGDALAQAFFIWIADNDKDGFAEAIPCINPFESAIAFFKGLIPWKATTNQQIAAHLTADAAGAMIVVMHKAITVDNYTWEQAGTDYATTFAAYVAGDILGAGFAKYGVGLAKGVVKKFDPFVNPNGFFGITFTYKKICKWFGGGLKNGNFYNLPTCNTCFFNAITNQFEPVKMVRGMKGWKVSDEVYLIGRSQGRVNGYRDFLSTQNVSFTVKTINDDIPSANWTYEANKAWVENLKKEGKTIIDIGDVPSLPPSNPDPLAMEYSQIFN